jgi:hypothetical protein
MKSCVCLNHNPARRHGQPLRMHDKRRTIAFGTVAGVCDTPCHILYKVSDGPMMRLQSTEEASHGHPPHPALRP